MPFGAGEIVHVVGITGTVTGVVVDAVVAPGVVVTVVEFAGADVVAVFETAAFEAHADIPNAAATPMLTIRIRLIGLETLVAATPLEAET